ncbi:energy-coupling factor ABC transporter ATP-binding protein [Shimia sediminis]|uniref:energy-coupling factor ABC transporter ATP-binding protein n=1 Tax=Shimia sediminis TaxID=2497945 RepID=UPI000F8F2B98|nr:ATP-binding cassette domain-containing protein [Shimia sediminis]
MIEIDNVTLRYGDRTVLSDISLSLGEARIAIIGANGSGKSSFARLLNGLVLPSEGTVRVDGMSTKSDGKDVRRKVGFVFQNPDNQIVFPVVEEDLAFGMKNLGFSKEDIARKTTEILARYDMSDLREHPAHLLSGGQKQLLAISGVLVMEPAYVVLDEPTTLLDLRNKRRVTRAIDALEQTVILASHDLELLQEFDRVIVFDEGRIVADDTPDKAIPFYVERMS